MKTFEQSLLELENATDAGSIEAALESVSTFSSGSEESRVALVKKLEDVCNGGAIQFNAKQRRKIKRLSDSLTETKPLETTDVISSSALNEEPLKKKQRLQDAVPVVAKNMKLSIPSVQPSTITSSEDQQTSTEPEVVLESDLKSVIADVNSSKSAVDLETALAPIKADSGNCHSRRSLKRAIEHMLKKEEIESGMNAKVRRRMNRVLGWLAPGAAPPKPNDEPKKTGKQKDKKAEAQKPPVVVPYIVFVGQLAFDTTAEEVEQFLRSRGVLGKIKVRLLTDPQSGRPKGMGFVELDEAVEMHKCIALHHTVFQGRLINIEKSCGGKNKERRKSILTEKKSEQLTKLSETMERVLQEFESQGVIEAAKFGSEFKEKVMRSGPAVLSKVKQYI